ncbi:hypothetical protein CTAYLR_005081 [Chrysophaeum taylorii]|uniref:Phospholipase/carboxylesterase/thioesterase domain-containing protein n=1 Tax=Chrysophaeum taylorii TaxID=2483200 RepID=A0AAD7XM00_9STRA|nr:hypothetical protein CTAYLR_005081 [Chrysophaeum taylorii]
MFLAFAAMRLVARRSGVAQRAVSAAAAAGDGSGGEGLQLNVNGEPAALTVIWCHGLGDSAYGWASAFVESGCITLPGPSRVVLPTAPSSPVTINGGMVMPSWYDIRGLDRDSSCDEEGIKRSVERVVALVARESTPVVLGGFSQGGAVALSAALRHALPNLVGVVAASTYLPLAGTYAPPLPNPEVPFLVCHGDADPVVDPDYGKATHDKLVSDLGVTATFRMFPGLAHSASLEEFRVISDFIAACCPSTK